MIVINHAILHILDFNSNVTVFSEEELDIRSASVDTFLTKHIEKSLDDPGLKSGTFSENSKFKKQLNDYINNDFEFVRFSKYIADILHSTIAKSDRLDSLDLIICDFDVDDSQSIGILECVNKIGFTHYVEKGHGKIKNDIINHYAILPSLSQKLEECAFINTSSAGIKFMDKKRSIEGQDTFIIPDVLLECSSSISPKDTIKLVNSITRKVAEEHGQSSVLAVSKAKNYIIENTEVSECLEPRALVKEVFASKVMQEEFINEVKSAGVPETVRIEKDFALKANRNHKIKTDTGIEISVPVDYFQNKNYIEFINNPNGSISIEIKNIGKIINR